MTIHSTYGGLNTLSMLSTSGSAWDQQNTLEAGANTLGAAFVDLGVGMWNSVANLATLGSYEDISTRSILQDLRADGAVAAYDNNKDAVELLSFVGGVLIPGMAAVKVARGVRAGMKGTSFLSPMRHKEDLLKMESLVKNAQSSTQEFKQLKKAMFLRGQANNVMDNVAAEVAILGVFNAHPYMEDYLEDPASNFAISMALGTFIGGGISALATKIEAGKVVAGVEKAALGQVTEAANLYQVPYADNVSSIVNLDQAVKNLETLSTSTTADLLTRQYAKNMATDFNSQLTEIVKRSTSEEILAIKDPQVRDAIIGLLKTAPLVGADRITFFKPATKAKEAKGIIQKAKEAVFTKKVENPETGELEKEFIGRVVYNPEAGAFIDYNTASSLSNAAERATVESITRDASKGLSIRSMKNSFEDIELVGNAGDAEVEYLKHLKFYSSQKSEDLAQASVIDGDLPALNGWVGSVKERLAELQGKMNTVDIEDFDGDYTKFTKALDEINTEYSTLKNAKLKITQGNPYVTIDVTEVAELPIRTADPAEMVKPTYFDDLDNEWKSGAIRPLVSKKWATESFGNGQYIESKNISQDFYRFVAKAEKLDYTPDMLNHVAPRKAEKYAEEFVQTEAFKKYNTENMVEGGAISDKTKLLLARWIGGNYIDKEIFRNAVASARSVSQGIPSATPYHDSILEILNHPNTLASKEAVKRHANAKGEMFLYRGTKTDPTGDTPAASYTHNARVAQNFGNGNVNMYKVHADDVLTYLYEGEKEWLVGAATRDYVNVSSTNNQYRHLNIANEKFTPEQVAANPFIKEGQDIPNVVYNNVDEVENYVQYQSIKKFQADVGKGTPIEVAALKYNITPEVAPIIQSEVHMALAVANNSKALETISLNRWTSPSKIAEALSPARRQITVQAKRNKHLDKTGELLDKQRQYIRDLGAVADIKKLEAQVGPVQPKLFGKEGTSREKIAKDLGFDPAVRMPSEAELTAAIKKAGYTGYQQGKYTVAANLSPEDKGVLERLVDTEGGQRIMTKLNITDGIMAQINEEFLDTTVLTSRSMLARSLYRDLYSTTRMDTLRNSINQATNASAGNMLTQSADFYTSMMGDFGRLVTAMGDERVHITNQVFNEAVIPITNQLKKLGGDDVARTEFAYFDNIRQSQKGFMRYDPEQMTYVKAPAGSKFDRATGKFFTISTDPVSGLKSKVLVAGEPITEYTVTSPAVGSALVALQQAGDELYEMQATLNRMQGKQAPSDIGFWIPPTNYVNKHRAYVQDLDTGLISMLVGNTADELKTLQASYTQNPNIVIRPAAELDAVLQHGFDDGLDIVRFADQAQQKKGVGLAVPDVDPQRLSDIVDGLRARMNAQAGNFLENAMYDVTAKLDAMSYSNTLYSASQSSTGFQKAVKQLSSKDAARDIKAILTGNTQIGGQEFMGYLNKGVSTTLHYAIQATTKAWSIVAPTLPGQKVDYAKYTESLRAQGIPDPYAVFNEAARPLLYEKAKLSIGNLSPDRVVNASNALAATMALRFMELAQPLVNMMSLPILMTSTISRSLKVSSINSPGSLMSNGPLAVMFGGIRRMNSNNPLNEKFKRYAVEAGLLDAQVSEVDDVLRQSRFATGGAIGKLEAALDSNFVNILSKPSEWADKQVRKAAFFTGVETAYRTYGPQISDDQVMIFARDFMKQAIGNYSTSQRPMMFQGTAGAAMGLFQTYMLTYAQNMYRHLEIGDYKGLGKTMLAQAGIFGAGSLPGFHAVSQLVGEHYSDDNIDFTTGLYRALPDELSDIIMYGMPSTIGPAVHTRGDVNPRIPTGFTTLVAPSMIAQATQSMMDVASAVISQDKPTGQAFLEALSTQSVSRPIARLSELASGYSVTGAGNQVAGPEEVWSWQGVLARAFSTRTLREAKAREVDHINSYYGTLNNENRQAVLETLRENIRNDSVTPELMDKLAFEYMRTGKPQGFRQAVNQAFMENSNQKIMDLHTKLGDSPLMYMLDDIE